MFDRQTMLRHHLQYNHYPPLPAELVEPCERAIEACERDEGGTLIELPTSYVSGLEVAAAAIVEAFHLEDFLDTEASLL
jgi:hypothetical protein